MAKKKDRAFFVCPRWSEIAGPADATGPRSRIPTKVLSAIAAGRPVARSTLRKALLAVRVASGSTVEIKDLLMDQRTMPR